MIKTKEIIDAINITLKNQFDYTVYTDFMPQNFERPSFFLCFDRENQNDANKLMIHKIKEFKLLCYPRKNDDFKSESSEFLEMQDEAVSLFDCGYLPVKDRSIHISASVDYDATEDVMYIRLKVDYFDDRFVKLENLPPVRHVETDIFNKE